MTKKRSGKRLKASFMLVTAGAAATGACIGNNPGMSNVAPEDGGYDSPATYTTSNNPGPPMPLPPAPPPDITLVNASPTLPPFRFCMAEHLDKVPVPNAATSKANGATSVAYATAVNIGSIGPSAAGTNDADAAALGPGEAGAPDAGDISDANSADASSNDAAADQTAYLIDETIANAFSAPDAGPGQSCAALVNVLSQNGYEGHGLYTVHGGILVDGGPQVIVISGCLPDQAFTAVECGVGFTGTNSTLHYRSFSPPEVISYTGKLAFQIATVAPAVFGTSVTIALGDGSPPTYLPFGADTPSNAVQVTLPASPQGYDNATLTLNGGPTSLTQTLTQIQALSEPNETPAQLYGQPVGFIFFVIGSPNIDPTMDPVHALHFLAVPGFTPPAADGGDN
jgi:hypothetical protein